jgi:hypothetical protein
VTSDGVSLIACCNFFTSLFIAGHEYKAKTARTIQATGGRFSASLAVAEYQNLGVTILAKEL